MSQMKLHLLPDLGPQKCTTSKCRSWWPNPTFLEQNFASPGTPGREGCLESGTTFLVLRFERKGNIECR
jgi:hypothetical protein